MYQCGTCGLFKVAADFFRDPRYSEWTPRSYCKACLKAKRKAPRVHWLAKPCTGCKQMVPMDGFYMQNGSPHMPCKTCRAAYRPVHVEVTEKPCSRCGITKSIGEFGVDMNHSSGHSAECFMCARAYRPATIMIPIEKRCPVCEQTKPANAFYKTDRNRTGLYSACKDCHNERSYAGQKAYKAGNPDQIRNWNNRWHRDHPEHGQHHGNLRRARQKSAPIRDFTKAQWIALKAAYRGCCAYCGKKARLTIDHVVPLAKGGSHTVTNIVPACKPCNSRKHDNPAPTHQPTLLV